MGEYDNRKTTTKGYKMKATIENVKAVIENADVLGDVNNMSSDIPISDQGVDSLDMANIFLLLEEEFDVKIPDEDLFLVQSIEQIVEYINSKA